MSAKILVATIALMVTRDAMTILPTTVPKHEVDVQRAIFGRENVQVLDDQSGAVPVEVELETEAERLEAKYGGGALEKAFGTNYQFAIAKAAKEHVVEAAATVVKPAGTEGGDLEAMTKAELLAEAEKRGVKADASMNKAQIVEAIETAGLL